jgi:phosphoserine/homoserine phosphotransferase
LQKLNYKVIGIGDSYNDISMLRKSDSGILFSPPVNVARENPDLTVAESYDRLRELIGRII